MLLFAFEYIIQMSTISSCAVKYCFASLDGLLEGRWESKGVYVFYLELLTDLVHLCVYLIFFGIVFIQYSLPIHLVSGIFRSNCHIMRPCRFETCTGRFGILETGSEIFCDTEESHQEWISFPMRPKQIWPVVITSVLFAAKK